MLTIVVGSTLKGLATGLVAGLVARWRRSTALGIGAGLIAGFALSSLAAIGRNGHYLEIVLPGMIVGALTGFVTQRYPQFPAPNRAARVWLFVLLAATLSSTVARTRHNRLLPPTRSHRSHAWSAGGPALRTGNQARARSNGSTSACSGRSSSRFETEVPSHHKRRI
jgi:hypothetical protein